jgi:hypothetical protein
MTTKNFPALKLNQPLDRVAILLMLVLAVLMGILVFQGDAVKASVRNFSWQNEKIGADNNSFSMTFSRPMNPKSVEENLKIDPPLAGKISWSGRRMVYTLLTPAPYGEKYQVKLENARDKFSEKEGKSRAIQPFKGSFTTRDRVLLYIGINPEDQGQLILYNLSQQQKKVLTPKDLIVMDFKPYPNGERILFSARPKNNTSPLEGQLYTVLTGVSSDTVKPEEDSSGRMAVILDNKDYQNLKFDLSPDGETIVVQRGKRDNPGDFGLWFMPAKTIDGSKPTPQRIKSQPPGEFMITPDSKQVAVAQGQGAAILPIQEDGTKPLDFLPQYGLVQAFAKDGSQAAMVRFNTDFTRELFLVSNQGPQKSLLRTQGSILDCQFDPASPTLYCIVTQVIPGQAYQEQPYLVAIDIKTAQQKPLLMLPALQRSVKMSLAPDGLALLFDQVVPLDANVPPQGNALTTEDGQPITSSSLWLMPLLPADPQTTSENKPEQLPFVGFSPLWLP